MGIDLDTARLLISSKQNGAEFTRILMLGRQALVMDAKCRRTICQELGAPADTDLGHFAEKFWSLLGAQEIVSLDASKFENASLVHDLNEPLPSAQRGQYDFVFDGGTLEHVFNFPVAIRNIMEAVKVGGHLFLHTPTNNYCGHGFYQFSPELFYRVLSEDNGFEIKKMIAYSPYPGSPRYNVVDPAIAKRRVELRYDRHQVLLLILAKRTSSKEMFKTVPQQSDYVDVWQTGWQYKTQPFFMKLRKTWRAGRLRHTFLTRCISLAGSPALTDAWENKRYSRRLQRDLFPIADDRRGR